MLFLLFKPPIFTSKIGSEAKNVEKNYDYPLILERSK
jgi:hypothetical protein